MIRGLEGADLKIQAWQFLIDANDAGYELFITWGKRTPAQIEAIGAAKNGQHLYGKAFDVQFWDPIYTGVWPCDPVNFHFTIAGYGIYDINDPRWVKIGRIGQNVGLFWGGCWSDYDPVHFQMN